VKVEDDIFLIGSRLLIKLIVLWVISTFANMRPRVLIMNGSRVVESFLIFLSCMIMHDHKTFLKNRINVDNA
jgi:hypothetical protein